MEGMKRVYTVCLQVLQLKREGNALRSSKFVHESSHEVMMMKRVATFASWVVVAGSSREYCDENLFCRWTAKVDLAIWSCSLWLLMQFAIRFAILIARRLSFCGPKAANHPFNLLPGFSSRSWYYLKPWWNSMIKTFNQTAERAFKQDDLENSLFHRSYLSPWIFT